MLEDDPFLDKALRPVDRAVYWCIAYHSGMDSSSSTPSYKTIAKESVCSRAAAVNAVRKLLERGYIEKERRRDTVGDDDTNRYTFVRRRPDGGGKPNRPPSQPNRPPQSTRKTTGGKPNRPKLEPIELESNELEKRDPHESRTSAAPRISQAPAASIPLSLRSAMEEEARKAGIKDRSFMESEAWWAKVYQKTTKQGATPGPILENWKICLSTRPDKLRFFARDYSERYASKRKAQQEQELKAKHGPKDAGFHPDVLAVMETAEGEAERKRRLEETIASIHMRRPALRSKATTMSKVLLEDVVANAERFFEDMADLAKLEPDYLFVAEACRELARREKSGVVE